MATGSSSTLFVTDRQLSATWRIAEELYAAGQVVPAIQVLDGLLLAKFPVDMAAEELASRTRIAEFIMASTLSADVARRVLEPAPRLFADLSIKPQAKLRALRLLGMAYRRKNQYTLALQTFEKYGALLDEVPSGKLRSELDDVRVTEVVRIRYTQVVETSFQEPELVAQLLDASARYAKMQNISCALVTGVAHIFAHLYQNSYNKAAEHAQTLVHRVGPASNDLHMLHSLIQFCAGMNIQTFSSQNTSPPAQSIGGGVVHAAGSMNWLSESCASVLRQLLDVLHCSVTGKMKPCEKVFDMLIQTVEGKMKEVSSATQMMTPAIHSEMRLLVAAKFTAFYQVVLLDLSKLDLSACVAKVLSLTRYASMFHRHTAHFRPYIHVLIATLALYAHRLDDCEVHLTVAEGCAVNDLRVWVQLLRCAVCYAQRARSPSAYTDMHAILSELESSEFVRENVSLHLVRQMMAGALSVDRHDYNSGTTILKEVVERGKEHYGLHNPIVACALRLLAQAQALGGFAEATEMTITTATQIATKSEDALNLYHCMSWVLSRSVIITQADSDRQRALFHNVTASATKYQSQLSLMAHLSETADVFAFLPGNEVYDGWMQRVNTASQKKRARVVADGGSNGQ